MRALGIVTALVATAVVTTAVLAVPGPAHTATDTPLRLPEPTGPYAVGVRDTAITDPSRVDEQTGRPRRLPVRVWYPAARAARGPAAPYLSEGARRFTEEKLGLPTGWLAVDTYAEIDAPARRSLAGVVLVQHGGGTLAAFQTGQVVDLASRGYAVVTVEHPHESFVIEEPDGTLIVGVDNPDDIPFSERMADGALVLREVPRLVPEAGPQTSIGMFGHSRGGAATAELMLHHPHIRAGVDLDGSPRGEVTNLGLDRPFGLMCGLDAPVKYFADFLATLRGPQLVRELAVRHYGFTDWVVFNPQAELAEPGRGVAFEQLVPTGTAGDLAAGERASEAQRQFLAEFLDRHL